MEITIDFGTSFGKIGLFDGDKLVSVKRGVSLDDLSDHIDTDKVSSVIISSVTHPAEEIANALNYNGRTVHMSHELRLPISINYETPETLGTDRLAAIVGARHLFPGKDILVIDTGTCITYDILDSGGIYHGGSISPGIELRFKALHNYTARLPLMEREINPELTGKSTRKAILSGVMQGLWAEMREIVRMYRNKFPHLQLVICGGDAENFSEHLNEEIEINPNLVLIGLKTVLDYNA